MLAWIQACRLYKDMKIKVWKTIKYFIFFLSLEELKNKLENEVSCHYAHTHMHLHTHTHLTSSKYEVFLFVFLKNNLYINFYNKLSESLT